MRILANENFPSEAVTALRKRKHDVAWIRIEAPGSSDQEVIARAGAEGRLIVSFDKDFGELAFRSKLRQYVASSSFGSARPQPHM